MAKLDTPILFYHAKYSDSTVNFWIKRLHKCYFYTCKTKKLALNCLISQFVFVIGVLILLVRLQVCVIEHATTCCAVWSMKLIHVHVDVYAGIYNV